MKLYVVRHGETAENAQGILCGQRIDSPLNDIGIAQAKETAKILQHYKFDAVYCSPLKRAQQTAEIIVKNTDYVVILDDRLRERDYGNLTGKSWAANFGEAAEKYRRLDIEQKFDYRVYGGESAGDVWGRLNSFLNDLRKKEYRSVLLVAHGGVLKSLKKHLSGEAYKDAPVNASVNEFEV